MVTVNSVCSYQRDKVNNNLKRPKLRIQFIETIFALSFSRIAL